MKPVPVIRFGFLQLLVLPGVPLLQLYFGFVLPFGLLLQRVLIWRGGKMRLEISDEEAKRPMGM